MPTMNHPMNLHQAPQRALIQAWIRMTYRRFMKCVQSRYLIQARVAIPILNTCLQWSHLRRLQNLAIPLLWARTTSRQRLTYHIIYILIVEKLWNLTQIKVRRPTKPGLTTVVSLKRTIIINIRMRKLVFWNSNLIDKQTNNEFASCKKISAEIYVANKFYFFYIWVIFS